MYHEFKHRAIDAVIARHGRRHEIAHEVDGLVAILQMPRQNIRRIGPEIGAEIVLAGALREFGEVFAEFVFRYAPCVIAVGLGKTRLRQLVHDLGPREMPPPKRSRQDPACAPGRSAIPRNDRAWYADCRCGKCGHLDPSNSESRDCQSASQRFFQSSVSK